jgi:hypothetical protein
LIEGRVGLVQGPDDLQRARAAMETLITVGVSNAQHRMYNKLETFFLNEALFSLPHLFPLTD